MKNFVKKFRILALVIAIGCAQATNPSKAQGAIGIGLTASGAGSPAGVPLLIAGGVLSALGFAQGSEGMNGAIPFYMLVVGAILLDDNQMEMPYAPIMIEDAKKLGVSEVQFASYNDEIEKINLIREQIQAEMYAAVDRGEKVDFSVAHEKWQHYKKYISPSAYLVLEKISEQVIEQLKSQI
jgi:hypothetical protein